ncbi:uncharacterized protein BO88DRAFT_350802, partial [Aspergillus vadensis CBS 113365]
VNYLYITSDKQYLAAAGYNNIKLYNIKFINSNPVMIFDGYINNITSVVFQYKEK